MSNVNRIMIVGTGSGCGKTTVTCALLKALLDTGQNPCAFKCGPDYIDPMFHTEIIGTPSRNLDLFLCGDEMVKYLLADAMEEVNGSIAVIEGVMGMYDGIGFADDSYSANHIARITDTPQILVTGVRGKSLSLLAELTGYLNFAANNIKGVILNHCSSGMYPVYKKMIEENLPVKVYGYLPRIPEAEIGSRHLGLVTAEEITDLKDKIAVLGQVAAESLDMDGLMQLAQNAGELSWEIPQIQAVTEGTRIAIARDKAFCFYYEDNFKLLRKLGAETVFFSPLTDSCLPQNISGLILGGGYPEEYLYELSENTDMLDAVRIAGEAGLPVYAECGGFMYLGKTITKDGQTFRMAGLISGNSHMTDGLVRFGYKTLTANCDNLMCQKGESIRCHEFHYSDTDCHGEGFTAVKGNRTWQTVQAEKSIFAGYPHLHLWSNPAFAENFVRACSTYEGGSPWNL